jgi:hypothetical protein
MCLGGIVVSLIYFIGDSGEIGRLFRFKTATCSD